MLGQPDRDLPARQEEALARLAATTEALNVLEETLGTEPDVLPETAHALLAGARALCPVAASTGTELVVSAGPDHRWSVRVAATDDGPRLRLRPVDAPPTASDVATPATGTPATDVAGQLPDLLRSEESR
jgi:hypothetical protein